MTKKHKQRPRQAGPGERRLREGLKRADALMACKRWADACALLRDLDQMYPQRQEILRLLVETAVALDDSHLYQYGCEKLHAQTPRDPDLPYMLTRAYLKNGWFGLCLSMARRALAQAPVHDKARSTQVILTELEPRVNAEIERLGLSGADGQECLILHDKVRSFLAQGRYAKAHESAEQLLKRRPRFAPAYNNGAEAAFHDGRVSQAIDYSQRLLALEPDNLFALCNLIRFLCVAGKLEEARRRAEQLKAIEPTTKSSAVKQTEAFAWLGDDAAVLEVYARGRDLAGGEGPEDDALLEHLAGVAAYRQGKEEEARAYWRSSLQAVPQFQLARDSLKDLEQPINERNVPWYYDFPYFVPRKLMEGLAKRLAASRGQEDESTRSEAQRYVETHPELEGVVPLLLDRSDGPGRELALLLAGYLRTPAMLQAARTFAQGVRGSERLRAAAAELADTAGSLHGDSSGRFLGRARHGGTIGRFDIHTEPMVRTHSPGVLELLTRGMNGFATGDAGGAERLLRQALAIDPHDPVVMNNLAVVCAQLGRPAESEALSLRLYESHPDYLFGRTALASLAAERGELIRARHLLAPLEKRTRFHVGEFVSLCLAEMNVYLAEGNRQEAQSWFDMWREVTPDHPSLGLFQARL